MTASVVPFPAQGEPAKPKAIGRARGWLERQANLPSPTHVKHHAKWWATTGAAGIGATLIKAPYLLLCELRPIFRGLGRILTMWSRWVSVADHADTIVHAEGSDKARFQDKIEAKRSGRRRLSLIVAVILLGVAVWAGFVHPHYLLAVGIVAVGVFDGVGRKGVEKPTKLPAAHKAVLKEGVPLGQITQTLIESFLREGLEIGVASPMRYDAAKREYRIRVSCLDQIEAKHLRAVERGIGAEDHTIRSLATDTATVRELVIRDGDPLSLDQIPQPAWIDTGTVSFEDPQDLGVSMTEVPFALDMAGVHIRVVAGTGGGKTSWFLRTCIDRVSACRDAVLWGVDLTAGPEIPLWRGVIQRRAFTPEDADELLDAALVEIARRAKILAGFAEDDDPSNDDITEWCSRLGPWLVIVIDEFSTLAEYNGKPAGALDLLGKAKQIVRTGRKHGVSLVMFAQRTGNEDFGSTVMGTQAGTAIVGPCDMTDTVNVFGKDRRDQGYEPQLLTPGTKESPNDAGKCFVDSPRHRTADVYRAYRPLSAGEVKRRARQRITDGLPTLRGRSVADDEAVDVCEVPPILAAVEKAFADAGNPEWMATAELLPMVQAMGLPELTENSLSVGIPVARDEPGSRRRRPGGQNPVRGYLRVSIQRAMEQL